MHSIHILRWDRCSGGREEETQSLSFCCGHWSIPPDNFPVSNPLILSSISNEAWPLVSYATLWICTSSIPMDFWKPSLTWKSLFSGKYQTKISPHCFADKWPKIITLRVLEEVMHWPVTHSSFAFRPWPTFSLQRINVKSVFFHLCLINRNTFQRINSFKILMELLSSRAALPRFSYIIVMLL